MAYQVAVEAGARAVIPVTDGFWGDPSAPPRAAGLDALFEGTADE